MKKMLKYNNFDIVYIKKLNSSKEHFKQEKLGIVELHGTPENIYDKNSGESSFFLRFSNGDSNGWYESKEVEYRGTMDKKMREQMALVLESEKKYRDARETMHELLNSFK